ncbi:MAG: TetR family transcriptional regulator [Planctomyces sp.]|nr:TetR family transcriptional regulator [Planctomyces sp.]
MKVSKERAAENRKIILEAAARMFRLHGVDGVGVADVMRETGLTHGALYSHFSSKDELVAASCVHAMDENGKFWRELAGGSGEADSFTKIVRFYLSPEHRDRVEQGCVAAALSGDIARQSPSTRQSFTKSLHGFLQLLMGYADMRSAAAARRKALVSLSAMIGALTLARAVEEGTLSDEILQTVTDELTKNNGRNKTLKSV